jgi:hypothetical protein
MKQDVSRRLKTAVAVMALYAAGAAPALAQSAPPKFSAKVPPEVQTPDTVQTRIGTLKFFDGAPDEKTVKLVYDQLDFGRGVEAFMAGMPAASVYGVCERMDQVGVKRNQAFAITEDLMDARSLFLTPNTTAVYVIACLDLSKGPMVLQAPPNVLGNRHWPHRARPGQGRQVFVRTPGLQRPSAV